MMETNKIHNMDCIEGMNQMEERSVDLIITDPPYDVNYMGKVAALKDMGKGTKKHTIDSVDGKFPNIDWKAMCWRMRRALKMDSHLYMFLSETLLFKLYPIMNDMAFKFQQLLIWAKNRPTFDMTYGLRYKYKHEIIAFYTIGNKKLIKRKRQYTLFNHDIMGDQRHYIHPTQKPIEIIRELILNSTKEGDLVMDPFMGSGTTAMACKELNRNFIGFEISPEYCRISNERLNQEKLSGNKWFK